MGVARNYLTIGLMSGTSMDGIDAVLMRTDGEQFIDVMDSIALDYPRVLQIWLKLAESLAQRFQGQTSLVQSQWQDHQAWAFRQLGLTVTEWREKIAVFCQDSGVSFDFDGLVATSTEWHLNAVRKLLQQCHLLANDVSFIGYHGQTLYHAPQQGLSLQVGHAQYLAQQLGISVVHQFRQADLDRGGQGAPLAPVYHAALAAQQAWPTSVWVNCGGIANVTVVAERGQSLLGFDTGPGNCLLDRWVRQKTEGRCAMDVDGRFALQGMVNKPLLAACFKTACRQTDYFSRVAPKSLNNLDFILPDGFNDTVSLEEGCATLAAFTIETLVSAVEQTGIKLDVPWVLAGGGWHHQAIYQGLLKRLPVAAKVLRSDAVGYASQTMEAELMAYLAVRCVRGLPITFPLTTGVSQPTVGGERVAVLAACDEC